MSNLMMVDTTFCVDLLREARRGLTGPATGKLAGLGDTRLFIPLFVACELQAGAQLSNDPPAQIRAVEHFVEQFEVVLPDRSFAVAYGETEAHLRKAGTPLPVMDVLIGVLAKSQGMPLLTRDTRHYSAIEGLVAESY